MLNNNLNFINNLKIQEHLNKSYFFFMNALMKTFKKIDLKKLEQLMNEIIYKLNENYVLSIKEKINFDHPNSVDMDLWEQ